MLASVFLMQPLGQAAAYIVCIIALLGLDRQYGLQGLKDPRLAAPIVDKLWRWVTGFGAIPAVIAIIFRLTIPESGRFTLNVQHDATRAIQETQAHFSGSTASLENDQDLELSDAGRNSPDSNESPRLEHEITRIKQFSWTDIHQHFIIEKNWRYLAATSICWFMLDFAYYGLQMNSPRTVARLWQTGAPGNSSTIAPAWQSYALMLNTTLTVTTTTLDPAGLLSEPPAHLTLAVYDTPIYNVILDNARNALISVSIGSLLGSFLLIAVINYLPRKRFLVWSFLALAVLVAATGLSFHYTFRSNAFGATLALYVLCQALFNLGPNALTFIIPAEIFPTRYRCTCHGISAASGKLASILVQLVLPRMQFAGRHVKTLDSDGFGYVLVIFAGILALGAPFAWAWLPEVQTPRDADSGRKLMSKTLEELAKGIKGAEEAGEIIGFRPKLRRLFKCG